MSKPFHFARRELLEDIAAKTGGRCLLAFSRGKDSLAAWLELRESGLFPKIVPFHLNGVPGMRFIEDSLDHFEDVFQTRIIRLPHIALYRQIGNLVFQPPERIEIIRRLGFDQCTRFTYNDVRRWLAQAAHPYHQGPRAQLLAKTVLPDLRLPQGRRPGRPQAPSDCPAGGYPAIVAELELADIS